MNKETALYILAPLAIAGLRWGAIAVCEWQAAKAEADDVDDWRDEFWPSMLARLSSRQARHVEREIVERITEKETKDAET